jgi:NADPH-dependent 2,4-dienoyl-CoA reductase/sulfur reductase-like enzyme
MSIAPAFAVHGQTTRTGARRAVIVGAGYTGMELADAFAHRGVDVTVFEMLDQVLPTVDPQLADPIQATLERHGVTLATGVAVAAIEQDGARLRVCGDDGVDRQADVVIVAAGVPPDTTLAQTASVELGARGAIVVDHAMRTGVDDILAAGDCVETWHALLERPTYLPLGTTAHKQGRVAAAPPLVTTPGTRPTCSTLT